MVRFALIRVGVTPIHPARAIPKGIPTSNIDTARPLSLAAQSKGYLITV